MLWTRTLLLLVIFLPQTANKASAQTTGGETKQVKPLKPKSKEYRKIEDKIRHLVAEYYHVAVNEIEVNAPISKRRPNAGSVTVVMVLIKVEETFELDLTKVYGASSVSDLADDLTIEDLATTVYNEITARDKEKKRNR